MQSRQWTGLAPLVLTAIVASSCATMDAGSDYYGEADFTGYRSFAWVSESPMIRSESSRVEISPLDVRHIRESIERELTAKGFDLVADRAAADFAVAFTVGARDMIQVNDYPAEYRGPWRWGPPYYWPNVDVYMYTEGMLAVDVFDSATREPVWHGWARKQIIGSDIEDPQTAIEAAVSAIFADFPPPP